MQSVPAPRSGDALDLKSVNGALLYITVHEVVRDIQTTFGASDAVRADVAVLDGDRKGDTLSDTLFFPRVLRSQLEQVVGEQVVGRLGQLPAKPGQSPAWVLNDATPDDMAVAEKYEAYAAKKAAEDESPF